MLITPQDPLSTMILMRDSYCTLLSEGFPSGSSKQHYLILKEGFAELVMIYIQRGSQTFIEKSFVGS